MKEKLHPVPKAEIKWPQGNKVGVGSDVEFVYIMQTIFKNGNPTCEIAVHLKNPIGIADLIFKKIFMEYTPRCTNDCSG